MCNDFLFAAYLLSIGVCLSKVYSTSFVEEEKKKAKRIFFFPYHTSVEEMVPIFNKSVTGSVPLTELAWM